MLKFGLQDTISSVFLITTSYDRSVEFGSGSCRDRDGSGHISIRFQRFYVSLIQWTITFKKLIWEINNKLKFYFMTFKSDFWFLVCTMKMERFKRPETVSISEEYPDQNFHKW